MAPRHSRLAQGQVLHGLHYDTSLTLPFEVLGRWLFLFKAGVSLPQQKNFEWRERSVIGRPRRGTDLFCRSVVGRLRKGTDVICGKLGDSPQI